MKKILLNILLIVVLILITGCGKAEKNNNKVNNHSYYQEEKVGNMNYVIPKKPTNIDDHGEKIKTDYKYHSIIYEFGDYYIVVKMSSDEISDNDDYVDKEVNGVKYRYRDNIYSGSGLRYSSIFKYDNLYYSIEYFQYSHDETEESKKVYSDIVSSVNFS